MRTKSAYVNNRIFGEKHEQDLIFNPDTFYLELDCVQMAQNYSVW